MTVYVDNMRRRATVGRTNGSWSHLLADSPEELREFANRLGLNSRWIQHEGTYREHFDVVESVRQRAINLGAEAINWKQTGVLLNEKRGTYGVPQ
jgi:hypothetical protein